MENVKRVNYNVITDNRGDLIAIEYPTQIDFPIKRVYYIYNVGEGIRRGNHSHTDLEQILIAVSGTVKVLVKTPFEEEVYDLTSPDEGLYIGNMIWREMFDFSEDAVLLVLASKEYNEEDYIRNYEEYEAKALRLARGSE